MRKGFVRAKNSGKSYYLEKHLMFLNDFIKPKKTGIKKQYVRTPYKPLRLSPVEILSDVSSEEEILNYKDVLEAMNHFSKKADDLKAVAQKDAQNKKENESLEMMPEAMNHSSKKADDLKTVAQKDAQDKKEDESFDMMSEVEFFNNLRKNISTIPKVTKVPCLMEICQVTKKYFAD